jgi:hypothetical protein
MLEELGSIEEVEDAIADPVLFLRKLVEESAPAAKKLAIMHLKPKLKPYLKKQALEWADVVPMLEELGSIDEVEGAIADPEQFLRKLAKASAPAAKKLAIMRLKPKLEPYLKKQALEWADVVPMLEELCSIQEVEDAIADPEQFLRKLVEASAPAAKKLAIMYLKPKLEPYREKQGLEWADAVPMLEELGSIEEEVEGAIADPEQFLRKLVEASAPAAKKLATIEPNSESYQGAQGYAILRAQGAATFTVLGEQYYSAECFQAISASRGSSMRSTIWSVIKLYVRDSIRQAIDRFMNVVNDYFGHVEWRATCLRCFSRHAVGTSTMPTPDEEHPPDKAVFLKTFVKEIEAELQFHQHALGLDLNDVKRAIQNTQFPSMLSHEGRAHAYLQWLPQQIFTEHFLSQSSATRNAPSPFYDGVHCSVLSVKCRQLATGTVTVLSKLFPMEVVMLPRQSGMLLLPYVSPIVTGCDVLPTEELSVTSLQAESCLPWPCFWAAGQWAIHDGEVDTAILHQLPRSEHSSFTCRAFVAHSDSASRIGVNFCPCSDWCLQVGSTEQLRCAHEDQDHRTTSIIAAVKLSHKQYQHTFALLMLLDAEVMLLLWAFIHFLNDFSFASEEFFTQQSAFPRIACVVVLCMYTLHLASTFRGKGGVVRQLKSDIHAQRVVLPGVISVNIPSVMSGVTGSDDLEVWLDMHCAYAHLEQLRLAAAMLEQISARVLKHEKGVTWSDPNESKGAAWSDFVKLLFEPAFRGELCLFRAGRFVCDLWRCR